MEGDGQIIFYTSKGRSRCFVFDHQFEFARFSKRQNQSVQKTPLVCMCPTAI